MWNGTFGSDRSTRCWLTEDQANSPSRGDLCVLKRQPLNRPFHRIENNINAPVWPSSTVMPGPSLRPVWVAHPHQSTTHQLRSNRISIAFGLPGLKQLSHLDGDKVIDDSPVHNGMIRRSQTSDQRVSLGRWYGTIPLPIGSNVVQKGIDQQDQLLLCRGV